MKTGEPDVIEDTEQAAINARHVSCRVSNSILKYLVSKGYDAESIIEGLPFSKEYLSDPLNWMAYHIREGLMNRAVRVTGDEQVMYKIGLEAPKNNSIGGVEHMIHLVGSPRLAYRSVPKYARLFDRITNFETRMVDDCQAIVSMSVVDGRYISKRACYYAQGILAAIPTLWGLPAADVHETKCMCDIKGSYEDEIKESRADRCTYEVRWEPLPPVHVRLSERLFGRGNSAVTLKKLEENFRLLDHKNTELIRRNGQLSKVREIALGIDSARSVAQVMELVVELARDIPGVCFVLIHKIDEQRNIVTTPYYSHLRKKSTLRALQSIGFDFKKQLGKNSTDKILTFPLDQMRIAGDIKANPRVVVMEKLSELLAGVWPSLLCDTIQRISGIKRLVIVPVIVAGKSWAAMLFFLDDEVPVDILEMVGAHCASAIKNVSAREILERHNLELTSVNTLMAKTATSLDILQILDTATREVVHMFHANAVAIYQVSKDGQCLKLRAQQGMPEVMVERAKLISLEDDLIGKFFKSGKRVMVDDFRNYRYMFPDYQSTGGGDTAIPFITVTLGTRSPRGLLIVARRGEITFGNQEQALLMFIANQLSISLENAWLHREMVESEERLRLTIQSAAVGITVSDLAGKITRVNDAVARMQGYESKEEMIGLSAFDFVAVRDRPRIADNIKRARKDGESGLMECTIIRKDGSEFSGELNVSLLRDANGNVIGFVASTRDVTERKKSEIALKERQELIERILESTPNAVLVVDRQMKAVIANFKFHTMFKTKSTEIQGKPIQTIPAIQSLSDKVPDIMKGKVKELETEFRYSNNGKESILVARLSAMQEKETLIIITDVTEERARQERLYLTDRLASVGEMASGIAHELNNPLTSIIGLSELLTEEELPANIREDVNTVNSEAQRAAAIVKNLLSFARKHEPKKQLTQLNRIIDDVLKLRAYEQKVNNITVERELDPELPEIKADYYQMQQVFLNLILNAEQAMAEGHGKGTLKIISKGGDGIVKVSFIDDGPGIAPQNLVRIFDPFFTTKEVGKGTGLGLSICYGIVTAHNGKIYARSEAGKGATFIVELPV